MLMSINVPTDLKAVQPFLGEDPTEEWPMRARWKDLEVAVVVAAAGQVPPQRRWWVRLTRLRRS